MLPKLRVGTYINIIKVKSFLSHEKVDCTFCQAISHEVTQCMNYSKCVYCVCHAMTTLSYKFKTLLNYII